MPGRPTPPPFRSLVVAALAATVLAAGACSDPGDRTVLSPLRDTVGTAPAGPTTEGSAPEQASSAGGSVPGEALDVSALARALAAGDDPAARLLFSDGVNRLAAADDCAAVRDQQEFWSRRVAEGAGDARFAEWAVSHARDVAAFIGCAGR